MKVAVLSDTHDRIDHLSWAISEAEKRGVERLFHCGDLISPFMVLTLAKFQGKIDLILGNNRGDVALLLELLKNYPDITLHGDFAYLKVEGYRIAMVHYPKLAIPIAKSQEFDYVFCGHTHKFDVREFGKCLFINPGELMGKEGPPSFVVLDLKSREWERIVLEEKL